MTTKINVIIVNWNGKHLLAKCLDGLRNQVYRSFKTTLADNGSQDGSVAFVEENYPEVIVKALPKNVGFCSANNLVLESADCEFVALLNNDAVPHSLWLSRLVDALEKHDEAGFAASKMVFYDRPTIIDRAGDSYTRAGTALLRGRGRSASRFKKREWIFGACAGASIYRTSMIREVGLFDEDFFLSYEDVDLSFRAQLMGYKCLYVPEAIVYHRASSTIIRDSPVSVYYSHRNLEWTYIKNMPTPLLFRSITLHAAYILAAFLYFLASGRGKDFLKAKYVAIKGIRKMLNKRRHIQRKRKVSSKYIWDHLEKERFLDRIYCRIRSA